MPTPLDYKINREWIDPNYPGLKLETSDITDHFYDTGLYQ